jgi:hypothetical protein
MIEKEAYLGCASEDIQCHLCIQMDLHMNVSHIQKRDVWLYICDLVGNSVEHLQGSKQCGECVDCTRNRL